MCLPDCGAMGQELFCYLILLVGKKISCKQADPLGLVYIDRYFEVKFIKFCLYNYTWKI